MLANALRLGPPLQALRALVPDCDPPFRIEHVDRITLRAVDKQVQLLSGSGPSAQTRRDLLILLAERRCQGAIPAANTLIPPASASAVTTLIGSNWTDGSTSSSTPPPPTTRKERRVGK